MTISKDLFLAVLSMDTYNRGYGAGLSGLDISDENTTYWIGNARILRDAQDPGGVAEAAGFYAIAYEMTADVGEGADKLLAGQISYRGTEAAA